jgi:hypothetical protein
MTNWLLGGKNKRLRRPYGKAMTLSRSADEEVAFLRTTKDRIARQGTGVERNLEEVGCKSLQFATYTLHCPQPNQNFPF